MRILLGQLSVELISTVSSTTSCHSQIQTERDIYVELHGSESFSVMPDSLQPHGLYRPQNSLSQNTGVGSLSLFQGIFPTQGLNQGLPHCRRIFYQLSHKGSPSITGVGSLALLQGVFLTQELNPVSQIAGRFFTNRAIGETLRAS